MCSWIIWNNGKELLRLSAKVAKRRLGMPNIEHFLYFCCCGEHHLIKSLSVQITLRKIKCNCYQGPKISFCEVNIEIGSVALEIIKPLKFIYYGYKLPLSSFIFSMFWFERKNSSCKKKTYTSSWRRKMYLLLWINKRVCHAKHKQRVCHVNVRTFPN